MGSWRDAFPSKWFSHKDLEGPVLVTIKNVTMENVTGDDGDRKPVVWFNEVEKGLGLNLTNGSSIEKIAETPDPDKWPGTVLVLFKTQCDYKGDRVDCIRIRAPKPGAVLPEAEVVEDDTPF